MRKMYLQVKCVYERLKTAWLNRKKRRTEEAPMKVVIPESQTDVVPPPSPVLASSHVRTLFNALEQHLQQTYEFRFNVITETNEYRLKGSADPFRPLGEREENTLCIHAHQQGIACWDRDVRRYLRSLLVPSFHPIRQYMDELPVWDGEDRVRPLAARVSTNPLWVDGFRLWMLGMAAQWMGIDNLHANSVAPVLISRRQGRHKSTFCKMLLPKELQAYYTDNYDLNAESGAVRKLAAFGLINLDELDKFSDRKMALLKNVMQMADVNYRKAHEKGYSALPRIASFIATSNHTGLLSDPTGSRRFLCVEVDNKIDTSPIDHTQLYAQLKTELLAGERYWFTADEEAAIMQRNGGYQKIGMENEVFGSRFRIPSHPEEGEWLTSARIFEDLKKHHSAAMSDTSPRSFGKTLTALGLERRHTRLGTEYRVVIGGKASA